MDRPWFLIAGIGSIGLILKLNKNLNAKLHYPVESFVTRLGVCSNTPNHPRGPRYRPVFLPIVHALSFIRAYAC